MKSDLEVRQDVERELAWDPRIDAANIAVAAKQGVVTLTGQVRNFIEKWEAEDAAKRVAGVIGIANDLEVTLVGPAVSDTDLAQRVSMALQWNAAVPADAIKAVVSDGWVTLEGSVQWYHQKAAAEDAVRSLHGVRGVTNLISIDNPVDPQDLSGRISEALTRNAHIDARNVTVRAEGHTVVLEGSVRTWAEREEAEKAAWAAPGVTSVENRLVVLD